MVIKLNHYPAWRLVTFSIPTWDCEEGHKVIGENFKSLLKMGLKLWKDYEKSELQKQLEYACSSKNQKIIIAKTSKSMAVGFSIFSVRSDYVEGVVKSPTGYLEGIYVESAYRKKGIAKTFINKGEQWLKANNCKQIGSDTGLADKESRRFHKKLGFKEEDELVHFLKNIE